MNHSAQLQRAVVFLRRLKKAPRNPEPKPGFFSHRSDWQNGRPEHPNPTNRPGLTWKDALVPTALFMLLQHFLAREEGDDRPIRDTTWQAFHATMLNAGEVESVLVDKSHEQVVARLHPGAIVDGKPAHPQGYPIAVRFNIGSVQQFERNLEDAQRDLNIAPNDWLPVKYHDESTAWLDVAASMMPVAFTLGAWVWLSRRMGAAASSKGLGKGGPFSFGKMNAFRPTREQSTTRFADVAGLGEAKVEVAEFVQFLDTPARFTRLGATVPKGALLVGPPGTGKTLLAKAVAGEAKVPFFAVSGSDFVEMFAGVGASRVRDLFRQARENSPCIVYIDEIDAVGKKRGGGGMGGGGGGERESTLNQLLVEMDGFKSTAGIVVLASTNRADVLDAALLRPGRFDRQISCDLPTAAERTAIFRVHARPLRLDAGAKRGAGAAGDAGTSLTDALLEQFAAQTPGLSGSQIASICNEAALYAARLKKNSVGKADFDFAIDRVTQDRVVSVADKEMICFHEAGHALAAWFLHSVDPIAKISIIPRGLRANLGHTQYAPVERHLHSVTQLRDRLVVLLAGRAAEQLCFDTNSTGAEDDLRRVTDLARRMVVDFGMSEQVGPLTPQLTNANGRRLVSDALTALVDAETTRLVNEAYARACALITEHRLLLDTLSSRLSVAEILDYAQLEALLGPRPVPVCPHESASVTPHAVAAIDP